MLNLFFKQHTRYFKLNVRYIHFRWHLRISVSNVDIILLVTKPQETRLPLPNFYQSKLYLIVTKLIITWECVTVALPSTSSSPRRCRLLKSYYSWMLLVTTIDASAWTRGRSSYFARQLPCRLSPVSSAATVVVCSSRYVVCRCLHLAAIQCLRDIHSYSVAKHVSWKIGHEKPRMRMRGIEWPDFSLLTR